MHPKEYKQEKAGTGRLTHLCLPESKLHVGARFDSDPDVQEMLSDPTAFPVLLYPGRTALNLSEAVNPGSASEKGLIELRRAMGDRALLVFVLDSTWSGARKMLRLSPNLQVLPRIMFTPENPSRYVIKQQPQEGCLSTLEATHELLLALERLGMDHYPNPDLLLSIFERMQAFQLACAADPARNGYRRRAYRDPSTRARPRGSVRSRRENYLRLPGTATERLADGQS
jgi:DTW domain-containing protein YfiP